MSGFHYTDVAEAVTADGQGAAIVVDPGLYSVFAWGTFGTGTLKLQVSPDGGTTWIDAVDDSGAAISLTADGGFNRATLGGNAVRYDLTGSTGATVNMRLVKQG